MLGDKVIDLILYKKLYNTLKTTEIIFNKGKMDRKRQEYFNRKKQAKIFDELNLESLLIAQHESPSVKVKHTVLEAIFGALYLLFDIEKTSEFLKKIAILMNYEELT